MLNLLTALIGSSASILVTLGFVTGLALGVWMPYMAWSATRNIRQIRMQLERLNDILEATPRGVKTGPLGL